MRVAAILMLFIFSARLRDKGGCENAVKQTTEESFGNMVQKVFYHVNRKVLRALFFWTWDGWGVFLALFTDDQLWGKNDLVL